MIRIGLSSCFFHTDMKRPIFKGKTLLYAEQSVTHWLMEDGVIPLMLPDASGRVSVRDVVASVDGLVLQGGSDVSPKSYQEEPLKPEWSGDYIRDLHETALFREALEQDKPVLGLCRGLQLINVALGGSLYQDIALQLKPSITHRDWDIYDQLFHDIQLEKNSRLSKIYPGIQTVRVNSVHHQGIKTLGKGLAIEARAVKDQLIEAIRWIENDRYVMAYQWHPEWMDTSRTELLDSKPILHDFLMNVAQKKGIHDNS